MRPQAFRTIIQNMILKVVAPNELRQIWKILENLEIVLFPRFSTIPAGSGEEISSRIRISGPGTSKIPGNRKT